MMMSVGAFYQQMNILHKIQIGQVFHRYENENQKLLKLLIDGILIHVILPFLLAR